MAMTIGEKIKSARKQCGLSQEQLSEKLGVSRSAVAKWESDKGLPDIENIQIIAKLLNVSLDYLLDKDENIDVSVVREEINLENYNYKPSFSGRWVKKTGKKDMIVIEKYPTAEIHMLMGQQLNTRSEKVIDNLIGWLTDAPFGIPEMINGFKNADKEFYLVNENERQYFVMVTDEFIESRQLAKPIADKKFEIGNWRYVRCGLLK